LVFVGLLAAAPVWAADDEEDVGSSADEETAIRAPSSEAAGRTLAERIPSVTRRVFAKAGRLELTPVLGLTLNDPFYTGMMMGARADFHVAEWLFIEANGNFFAAAKSDVPVDGGSALDVTYDRPAYTGGLSLGFAPLYGKLSVMAERVLHFDAFVTVGGGVVGLKDAGSAVAVTASVGQHYFLNEWFGVRWEFGDQMYRAARATGLSKEMQHLLSFSLGAAFYVPPSFEHEEL